MRPKFRQKSQTNIYFLSQRKVSGEKKMRIIKKTKILSVVILVIVGGYLLSN